MVVAVVVAHLFKALLGRTFMPRAAVVVVAQALTAAQERREGL